MRWSPTNPTPTSPDPAAQNPPVADRLCCSPPLGRPAQLPPDHPQPEGRPPGDPAVLGPAWGSLGIDPLPATGARPRDQAGDASSAAVGPSVSAAGIVARVAAGRGPVSMSARPWARAGSASTVPRRRSSPVAVVGARVVTFAAAGSGLAERRVPAAVAVRPAGERVPLIVARAPVINTVPVTCSRGTSSTVPRVTGSGRQPTGFAVARPGRRSAATGEAGPRVAPLPASVALSEAGVGVPDPAPALRLAGAASQGARPHPMLDSPGAALVAVEVAPPELPGTKARHPLDRVQPLRTQLRLQRVVHRAEVPGHHVVPVGGKPPPIACRGTSVEVSRVDHVRPALRVVQVPARLARRAVAPGPLQRVPAEKEVERSVRVPGAEAAGARPP